MDSYSGKCKSCDKSIAKLEKYCHNCSYSKGIHYNLGLCKICGIKILNVKAYR